MELTRIINPKHLDFRKRRFSNIAFKPSSGVRPDTPDGKAGISVFDTHCACRGVGGACICLHIDKFYSQVAGTPCVYWTFDSAILDPPDPNPTGIIAPVILETVSASGDDCHRDIHHVTPGRAERIFNAAIEPPELNLVVCDGAGPRPFDWDELEQLTQG